MSKNKKAVTIADLELLHQHASFEAVGVLHGASAAVMKLKSFTENTSSFIKDKINTLSSYFLGLDKNQYQYYFEFAKKWKYMEIKHVIIQVPDGFKGNLSEYADTLLETLEKCTSKLVADVITPYELYISKLINQPSLLASHSYKHPVSSLEVEKYRKQIAKFHTPKKMNEASLGDVYGRMLDLETHAKTMDEILTIQKTLSTEDVRLAVNRLNENINTLIEVITDKQNNVTLSQKVINDLSDLTLDLAKQVEFYAVVDHLIAALTHCTIENINPLKRVSGKPSNESISVFISKGLVEAGWSSIIREGN